MATRAQAFYDYDYNPGKDALVAYMGAFLGERERMNMALLAQRMEDAAGGDDARLLQMEADLRQQALRLQQAGVQAKSGNFKAVADLMGNKWNAWRGVKQSEIAGRTAASVASVKAQADLAQNLDEIAAKTAAAMDYDDQVKTAVGNIVGDFAKYGDTTSTTAVQNLQDAINGQLKAANADTERAGPKRDRIITDAMEAAIRAGRKDVADLIGKTMLGQDFTAGMTPRGYLAKKYRYMPPGSPEREEYLRQFSAGSAAGGDVMGALEDDLMGHMDDEGAVSTETRTSGAVPGPAGASGGPPAPGAPRSVRVKGDARMAGQLLSTLMDPSASAADIDEAIRRGQADIDKQIATIEAQRTRRKGPIFTGANYLLDNPNVVTDTSGRAAFDRAAARDRATTDEFRSAMARGGYPTMRGFDPDAKGSPGMDVVALGKGGEANVYHYFADLVRTESVIDIDKKLAMLPEKARSIIAPYIALAKSNPDPEVAAKELDALGDTNPVTFHELYAADIRSASRNPEKLADVIAALGSLDEEQRGEWAPAVERTIDEYVKLKDADKARAKLGQIADAMDEGRATRARSEPKPALPDPKVAREMKETAARAEAAMAADAKAKADEALGAKAALDTWHAADATARGDLRRKVESMPDDSPFNRGMKQQFRTLAGDLLPPESPRGDTKPAQEDFRTPSPKVREDYLRTGVPDDVPEPSDEDDEDVDDAVVSDLVKKKADK